MTAEEIGERIDSLGLWDALGPYHWAVKPRGTAFPYFVSLMKGDGAPVKMRLMLLEGWQTFHDFIRTRVDRNYGFCTMFSEFPHFEMVFLADGGSRLYRHDPGYVPQEVVADRRALVERMLWEVFGVMMRVETDRRLPLRFATEKAIFARVEDAAGKWQDEPLGIPDPRPHVERVAFDKAMVATAKDMPFAKEEALVIDFRCVPSLMTREGRPRCAYVLAAMDARTGECAFSDRTSINPETGLRGLWEGMPPRVLKRLVERGRTPGEVHLLSGRVFRMLRPLCTELPFKLLLHDAMPRFEEFWGKVIQS